MTPVIRLIPALLASALIAAPAAWAAAPNTANVASAPASEPPAAAPAFAAPDADLLSGRTGSSAAAFKAKHLAEFAVTEGKNADFYLGVVQGLPAFVIYTHEGDRITGMETMVSGTRETMTALLHNMGSDYAIPGSLSEQTVECRDSGSKSVGWHLESTTITRARNDVFSYQEDPTNHSIVMTSNSPVGLLSVELLNKAYADALARADLRNSPFAVQWLGYKAAYDDVSHSKGPYGCKISKGGAAGSLPLKFDVALTQTGAQVINGDVDIAAPEQYGGLNFAGFQAVLAGGKVEGLRFSGNVPRAQFDETLKRVVGNLGDPLTLVVTSNGAQTQTVATFRPSQTDGRTRSIQTILTYRTNVGSNTGTLVFDVR